MKIYSVYDPEFKPYGQIVTGMEETVAALLSCLDPRVTISVSLPSRILGPGCADSAVLRVRVPGPEGLHHLLWKQHR